MARGYKTHNEFHKHRMKWKLISDSFYHIITLKKINISWKKNVFRAKIPRKNRPETSCFTRRHNAPPYDVTGKGARNCSKKSYVTCVMLENLWNGFMKWEIMWWIVIPPVLVSSSVSLSVDKMFNLTFHTPIGSCYLNMVAAGELRCLLTSLVNLHFKEIPALLNPSSFTKLISLNHLFSLWNVFKVLLQHYMSIACFQKHSSVTRRLVSPAQCGKILWCYAFLHRLYLSLTLSHNSIILYTITLLFFKVNYASFTQRDFFLESTVPITARSFS